MYTNHYTYFRELAAVAMAAAHSPDSHGVHDSSGAGSDSSHDSNAAAALEAAPRLRRLSAAAVRARARHGQAEGVSDHTITGRRGK
jgi:hypothetical protein